MMRQNSASQASNLAYSEPLASVDQIAVTALFQLAKASAVSPQFPRQCSSHGHPFVRIEVLEVHARQVVCPLIMLPFEEHRPNVHVVRVEIIDHFAQESCVRPGP